MEHNSPPKLAVIIYSFGEDLDQLIECEICAFFNLAYCNDPSQAGDEDFCCPFPFLTVPAVIHENVSVEIFVG
jgi:hypothetical protein